MPNGKLSAQTGHAFASTLVNASKSHPHEYKRYVSSDNAGSKVSLYSKSEDCLVDAYNKALSMNIPCSIIVDSNHIMLPHFDGSPIITALGIGPCTKHQVRSITKKFKCIK